MVLLGNNTPIQTIALSAATLAEGILVEIPGTWSRLSAHSKGFRPRFRLSAREGTRIIGTSDATIVQLGRWYKMTVVTSRGYID